MKAIYKVLLIFCLTFISLINVSGQTDTLIVVKVVAVDTNNSGRYNALEIEFNQPLDDATMDIWSRINDWYISNQSDMSPYDLANDFNTKVEYIATADQANDVFIRIGFNNPNGGDIADNTYDTIFINYNGGNNVLAYYTPAEYLVDTTSTVANPFYASDKAGPGINSVSFLPANGNTLGINDTLAITITIKGSETGLIADTLIINNTYVPADSLKDNDDGTYTFDYIINEGDNDIDDATEAIPISFILEDPNGNFSNAYTTSIAGNCPGIDANRPEITQISYSPGDGQTLKVGDVLTVTFKAENSETGLSCDSATVNEVDVSGAEFSEIGSGYYKVEYTVGSSDKSIDDVTEAVPVVLEFFDGTNYTLPLFEDSSKSACPGIDANIPSINTVSSNAESDANVLKVGETILFTITPDVAEENLTFTPTTYNTGDLNWSTSDVGTTYTATYTVEEGHTDRPTPLQLGDVYVTDANGNTSTSAYTYNLITRRIDANTPQIDTVYSDANTTGVLKVGESITFTVEPVNPEVDLTISPTTYNGENLTVWTTGNGGATYTATYTIADGHADRLSSPLQLLNVNITDTAGNTSSNFNGSDVAKLIDANIPSINTVSSDAESDANVLKVGETIIFTITPNLAEENLTFTQTTYNTGALNWSTSDVGVTYTSTYTVEEGHNNQTTPLQLGDVYVTDANGNTSTSAYTYNSITRRIDANTPQIDTVTSNANTTGVLKVGESITFTVTPDIAESDLTILPTTYNGEALTAWTTGDGGATYTATYNIADTHADRLISPLQLLNVNITDTAGNTSNNFNGSDVAKLIDANIPSINTVGSNAELDANVLKVGETILFTITPNLAEENLTFTPTTYNTGALNWSTSDVGVTYTSTYTVEEGHNNQITPLQLGDVYVTDANGNTSTSAYTYNSITRRIDANTPQIDTVTSNANTTGVLKVGESITFTVTPDIAEPNLTILPTTYNGEALTAWITGDGGATYTATYTIAEGHTDRLTSPLQLLNVNIIDTAGNNSNNFNGSDVAKLIDANSPSITSVVVQPNSGLLDIGDTIIFTVNAGAGEPELLASTISINSKNIINRFTDIGGGQYEIEYVIKSGDNDVSDASGIPLSIILKDVAGNLTSDYNSLAAGDCPGIDANKPIISNVTVTPATMLYGQNYTVTITVNADGDTYNLVSGKIAGFDLHSLSKDADDTYSGDFTVGDLGYDILPDDSYDVTNLVLSDPAGNLTDVYSKTITQAGDPIYTILPTAKVTGEYHVCDGDSAELSFQLTGSAPWEVELFDGAGTTTVSGIDESPYYYKVESNNVLGNEPDTVIYKISQVTDVNGNVKIMSGVDSAKVFIHKIPVVDITDPPGNQTYNVNADADTLTGSPVDGVFSGNGIVSSNNTFLPSSAGLGTWDIVYTYTVPSSGCSDSDTVEFKVIESDADITFDNGDDDWRCDYETTFGVTAEVITNPSIMGALKLYGAPSAITDHFDNTATIDVQQLSAGTYEVTFEYTDGSFTTFTKSFTVEKVGDDVNEIDFTDVTDNCEDYDTIFVNAINLIPSGGTGEFIFSGAGGEFEYEPTDPYNNSGYFLPGQISPGSYTLKYVYTTPNGCESDSVIKYFDVNALPNVSFTMNSLYNIDQGISNISGNHSGTTSVFTPLSFMSNKDDGTADFNPESAGLGNHTVTYTYTDTITGCVNSTSQNITVTEANGEINSTSGTFQYCYFGSEPDTIVGVAYNSDGTDGVFYIDDNPIAALGKDSIVLIPQIYGNGDHTIKFIYTNGTATYNIYKSFNVDSIGNINFGGFADEYCEDDGSLVEINAIPPTGEVGTNNFVGDGIYIDDDIVYFTPASNTNLGYNVITYTFERTYSGCVKTTSDSININKQPIVDFHISDSCFVAGDPILFYSDTLVTDSVVQWNWLFEGYIASTDQNPSMTYTNQGKKTIELTLTTNKGCKKSISKNKFIGIKTVPDFDWKNECFGETVNFEIITQTDIDNIVNFEWDFGDGSTLIINDTTESSTHLYASHGDYLVKLIEVTKTCGSDTVENTVPVRPKVTLSENEYFQDFESGTTEGEGWVAEDLVGTQNNTWEYGMPGGLKIDAASSGSYAWVTNINGNYSNNEKSAVTSPCFDFTSMVRPMMKMDFVSYTEENKDGVVIQYTNPLGDWVTIGVPNDGVNWFNSYIISGAPADQQLGWTGEIAEGESGWQTAMYRLDELRGREGVRFRIVFGSNGDFTDEGFAFDNIYFGERKRIVLLENFTNITDDDANNTQNDIINPILEKDSLDVINLNYHTSFPAANTFNSYYPSGPSARALYYGVSDVPYSLVDGGERSYDFTLTNTLAESDIHKRMLIDPQFDISVRQDIQGNNFVVSSTVKALEEMSGQNVIVYVAIMEKTVLDGSDRYNNVLRTMLPDAAGILVEKDWIVGDSVNVYQTWSISEGVNTDSLITIVFVQDEDTKEIYQTAFTEEFSTITSVDEIIDNIIGIDYMVYPNPVKEILTVKLTKVLTYDIDINVYNSVGTLVKSDKLFKGNYLIEINTNDLPSGVYYLRLTNTDKFFSTKKIIISN